MERAGWGRAHLVTASIAIGLAAAIMFAGRAVAIHRERSSVSSLAPELLQLKNQGLVIQRVAAEARDVLPIYGSSELTFGSAAERGSNFFRTEPTGFQVSPVGKAGATPLVIVQKLGALGSTLRGKKLAISLSPEWFLLPEIGRFWYEGNFSPAAANEMIFGNALNFELKREIASRMLEFPRTLTKWPLLEFALERLASGRAIDRLIFCAIWPIGKMQGAVMDLQDHFAALSYIRHEIKPAPPRRPKVLDWPQLIAKASEHNPGYKDETEEAPPPSKRIPPGRRDTWFVEHVDAAREWTDLELLLHTLAEIHAQPLLLSIPIDGEYYDAQGISRSARAHYYEKMRTLVRRYNFPLVEFEDHDDDPDFVQAPHSHLTRRGWMFYNHVLDDFFHGRMR